MITVLIDLEGTLSDHSDRLATLQAETAADPKNRYAWKAYYKGLPEDEPRSNVMAAMRQWIADEENIIVYSTRFINKYKHEEAWLRTHGLWDNVELLQRESTQTTIKGPTLVATWAGSIQPDILVDDREEVRELVKVYAPKATVLGVEDFTGG